MGMMGASSTGVSIGCTPKTSRPDPSVAAEVDPIQKVKENGKESDGESGESKAAGDHVSECMSERRGSRELIMRMDVAEQSAPILTLPDDVMTLMFARLPRHSLMMARVVCSSWKRVVERQELASLRQKVSNPNSISISSVMNGVAEGWIYILADSRAGSIFHAYDPLAAKWFILPPAPGRSKAGQQWQGFACVGLGHRILLIGGTWSQVSSTSSQYTSAVVCSDVAIYDALTNKWSKGANMSTPRSWAAAAVVGGKVYVAGGQGNTKFLDSAEVYDPESDTWKTIASMGVVRSSCQGMALDGQFWVIAGEYEWYYYAHHQKRSAEVYDVETDTWRCVRNMSLDDNKVMKPSAVVDGKLICLHQRRIMVYKKDSNTWNQLGHSCHSNSRFGFACESVGSNLYIIGGANSKSFQRYNTQLNSVEICNLKDVPPSQLWWTLGTDMSPGLGVVSASAVAYL